MSETLFAEVRHTIVKYKCKTERIHKGWEQHVVIDENGIPIVRTASYRAGSEAGQNAFLWLQEACRLYGEARQGPDASDTTEIPLE